MDAGVEPSASAFVPAPRRKLILWEPEVLGSPSLRHPDDRLLHPEQAAPPLAPLETGPLPSQPTDSFTYSPTGPLTLHDRHPGFYSHLEHFLHPRTSHTVRRAPPRPVVLLSTGHGHHHHHDKPSYHKHKHHHHHHHHADNDEEDAKGSEEEEPKPKRKHHHHRSLSAALQARKEQLRERGRKKEQRLEKRWVQEGQNDAIKKADAEGSDEDSSDETDDSGKSTDVDSKAPGKHHTDTESEDEGSASTPKPKSRAKSKKRKGKHEDKDSEGESDDSDDDKK